ncbi:hypothetical protein [Bradyrhizobium sp. CCBAU 53421]|uniref:hypothetical protein n=1 Tax=Bradyrhizobium sp. CCBAU 53421 TaxID=1325120 RepID=UPI00188DA8C6|nr:hypothetical protein [Bradyrhizobium sp. CCBAU 53421]QOZ33196.1 hypothetical protein XH92_17220 [Bradyrhizobium sp. CCBAU 53421]
MTTAIEADIEFLFGFASLSEVYVPKQITQMMLQDPQGDDDRIKECFKLALAASVGALQVVG